MEEVRSAIGTGVPLSPAEELVPTRAEELRVHDEEEALRARERYRDTGIPSLSPNQQIGPHLVGDERLLGSRDEAAVRRVDGDMRHVVREEGTLYVTDRRLIHLGQRVDSIPLLDIDELTMADDRILVTLAGARGITLDVPEPHQLRALIAAAKAALRAHSQPEPVQ